MISQACKFWHLICIYKKKACTQTKTDSLQAENKNNPLPYGVLVTIQVRLFCVLHGYRVWVYRDYYQLSKN